MNHNQLDDFFGLSTENAEPKQKEDIKDVLRKKLNIRAKLRLLPKVLSPRERYIVVALIVIAFGALISLPFTSYQHFTHAQADYGGSFSEGLVGEPHLINPLLAQSNDADRDLTALIYSSLMKYDASGKLVPDLAKSYEISQDGLTYTLYLHDNAFWHDGVKLTADDVIFTIQTAQNGDYGSLQRINWLGVDVAKVNDTTVMFKLKSKYAQFLNNFTIGILPKHIWQDIKPINFSLSEYNLKPIGSGPFKFNKLKKDKTGRIISYELKSDPNYFTGQPYIDTINIQFYISEDEMISAYNSNDVEGMSFVSAGNLSKIKFKSRLNIDPLKLPRYFAGFFNQNQSTILSDKNIRLALNYATDKKALVKTILNNNGSTVDSPMIGDILGVGDVQGYNYDLQKAKDILSASGWNGVAADGTLIKGPKATPTPKPTATPKSTSKTTPKPTPALTVPRLDIKITTSTWPELVQVANLLADQWKKAGIHVTIESLPIAQLQQVIKDRDYEVLLFGEIINLDPDPYSLWHSSQKKDPGLNLALYDNKTADKILEDARQTLNPLDRAKKYDDFQKIVVQDVPAVFLYSPYYLYAQSKSIHGFDSTVISMPSDRFSNVAQWYINTKRSWK